MWKVMKVLNVAILKIELQEKYTGSIQNICNNALRGLMP